MISASESPAVRSPPDSGYVNVRRSFNLSRDHLAALTANRNPPLDPVIYRVHKGVEKMFEGGISGEFTSVHELAKKMNSGQLKICSRIGEGMYSKVYGATIDKTHKVAIKWMDCENLRSEIRDKFLPREINNWKKICHPNLLRLFAIVEGISTKAMFCELTEYGDLLRILQKSGPRFPFAQKTLWIGQIVKAIDYLHSRNIAHRDLKCENCLYFPNDVIKVTDFGFCVETQRVGELSQTFCGSRAYSAPELVRGEPYDVFKVDIWALGVIIAVIVNHTMPYVDSSGVDNNAFLVHLQEQRILILNHAVPPKHLGMCQDSLDCLLRQYPAARPDSATLMFCAWWRCVTAWHGDHILLRQRIFEYLC